MWKKINIKKKIIKIAIIFILILWIYQYYKYQNFKNIKISTKNFLIKEGETLYSINNKLCDKKIIKNCLDLKIYTYFHKVNNIKPWIYSFSWTNLSWFFNQLNKWPKIKYTRFTILPWWTKFDIANQIKNKTIAHKFLYLMVDQKFINKMKTIYTGLNQFWRIKSLEGFLYPDTYFFKKTDLQSIYFPKLLIEISIKNFFKKIRNINWENWYRLTPYQILIISSIIEKEAKATKNKPYIANILIRRFKHNWKLWTDWTLCYGLKIISKDCKNYLYNKYLDDKKNKYNTRANTWLPPTPVWNPTLNTIKSTIHSKKNTYWYYLHDKNGQIHFGKTYSEHIANKYKYLK